MELVGNKCGAAVSHVYRHLVFVYGTLKKGEPNHHWITEEEKYGKASFVAEGTTEQKYPLVVASRFNIPYLLDSPGKGEHVRGEVYNVDERMLSSLDRLEDAPSYYIRREESIQSGREPLKCWLYVLPNFKPELLSLKCLESYSAKDPSIGKYVERHLRTDEDSRNYYSDVKQP